MIKSSDVGDLIGDLNPVKLNENFIRLPSVRDGFTLELVESSRPDVVALDGSVVHLTEDVVVTLKFKITNLSDPSDVVYVTSSVKVLGKGQPEGEDKTDNTTQSNNNNGQDTVTEVFAGDGFDWDFGFSTHWNGGEKGETAPTEKVENSGAQLSWLMLIILISIIVLVLLLTFMILIIMKRKSRAEQQQLGREE